MLPVLLVILACNGRPAPAALPGPVGRDIEDLEARVEAVDQAEEAERVFREEEAPGSVAISAARARHLARTFRAHVDALAVPSPGPASDHRDEVRALYALADVLAALYGDTHLGRGAAWDVRTYARRLEASSVDATEHAELIEAALRSAVAAVQRGVAERRDLAEVAAEAEWATEAIRGDRPAGMQRRTILRAYRAVSEVMLRAADVPEATGPTGPFEPPPPATPPPPRG